MTIQDLIFACGGLIFAIALLPSIRSNQKPALSTCIMSSLILAAFSVNDLTFDHPLYLAFLTTSLNALAWVVLGIQQFALRARTA